ncbi:MAG TPA: hypothetical protein VJA66_16575 [Thermoanaerobaculia bacterium]
MAEQTFAGDEIPAGSQVIEVHVAELSQIFNSFDPSPFHEKDLDDDAKEFIVGWAKELPRDARLALLVFLDKPSVTAKMADDLREAVHGFFARLSEFAGQRLRQLFRVGRTSLAIGLVFLALCLLAGHRVTKLWPGSGLAAIIREGLLIGGWVSMWRPLEIFLYDWWPILSDRRLYDRLSRMAVRIACADAPMPAHQSSA